MTTISGIGGASSAWSSMAAARGKMQEKIFEKVDADGSGGIDTTELQGLLDEVAKKTGASSGTDAAQLLAKLDSNGDGSLNSDELAEGMRDILPPPSTMEFAQLRGQGEEGDRFSKLDTDGDGSLSLAEFEAGRLPPRMEGPGGMPPPPPPDEAASSGAVQALFKSLDTDSDGDISQSESDAFVQQLSAAYESATTTASSASSTDVDSDSDSASAKLDLAKILANLMLRQYDQIASSGSAQASASTLSLVA